MIQINVTEQHKEILYGQSIVQYRNISRIKVANGHQIFKMNIDTLSIGLANYKVEVVKEDEKEYRKFSIEFESGQIYIPALNLKNAIRKANKILYIVDIMVKKNIKIANNSTKPMLSSLRGAEQINYNNP